MPYAATPLGASTTRCTRQPCRAGTCEMLQLPSSCEGFTQPSLLDGRVLTPRHKRGPSNAAPYLHPSAARGRGHGRAGTRGARQTPDGAACVVGMDAVVLFCHGRCRCRRAPAARRPRRGPAPRPCGRQRGQCFLRAITRCLRLRQATTCRSVTRLRRSGLLEVRAHRKGKRAAHPCYLPNSRATRHESAQRNRVLAHSHIGESTQKRDIDSYE